MSQSSLFGLCSRFMTSLFLFSPNAVLQLLSSNLWFFLLINSTEDWSSKAILAQNHGGRPATDLWILDWRLRSDALRTDRLVFNILEPYSEFPHLSSRTPNLFSTSVSRSVSPIRLKSITVLWPVSNYSACWQRPEAHVCEQLAQSRYLAAGQPGIELATSWSLVRCLNHYTTKPYQATDIK